MQTSIDKLQEYTVQTLINKLQEYNPDAKAQVVVDCYPQPFVVTFGSSEGCTKQTADTVSLTVNISGKNHEVAD